MTPRHIRFVTEYMKDSNGAAAADRAGYKGNNLNVIASRLLSYPYIKAEVERRMSNVAEQADVKAIDVLRELRRCAMADVLQFFDENGQVKQLSQISEEHRRAIVSIEQDELYEGSGKQRAQIGLTRKIKLADKIKALELLGKFLKLFTEKIEITDTSGLAERMRKARERVKNAK